MMASGRRLLWGACLTFVLGCDASSSPRPDRSSGDGPRSGEQLLLADGPFSPAAERVVREAGGDLPASVGCPLDPRRSYTPTGAAYHVNKASGSACADTNPGTASQPWCTLAKAAATLKPGETVYVHEGLYAERPVLKTSGAAGQLIAWVGTPSRKAKSWGFQVTASYVRIEGFDVTTEGTSAAGGNAIAVSGSHNQIVDNYLHDVTRVALAVGGDDNYVGANRIYRVQMGITTGGKGWLVEANEIERLFNFGTLGDADYSRVFGDGGTVRGNLYHKTLLPAETGSAHVDCFQTFDNNGDTLTNTLFERNICKNFSQAFMGSAAFHDQSRKLTFRNNLFVHGGAWGLCVEQIDDVVAVNNTFVDIQWFGAGFSQGASGAIVKNNIFVKISQSYVGAAQGDYNLVLDAKPAATPGAHDLLGKDPLFVNRAGDDFHLQPGSPALDSGETLATVKDDLECRPRPAGKGFDRGAYELP